MIFTDTHCHLNFDSFSNDIDQVIQQALHNNVKMVLVPGLDIETSKQAIRLAENHKIVFAAVGFHPNDLSSWQDEESIEELYKLAQHHKVVGIGEIGLDYYRNYSPKQRQLKAFQAQLILAEELQKPVIIHNRNSHDDILRMMNEWHTNIDPKNKLFRCPGVLHSFDGSLEFARNAVEMNFYLGISGPITYKNANDKRETIRSIPIEKLLLETDAPFLSPHPHRGKRNEPSYIPIIAKKLTEVKNYDLADVARVTTQNSINLFSWEPVN